MKSIVLFALLFCFFAFTCSKDNGDDPVNTQPATAAFMFKGTLKGVEIPFASLYFISVSN